MKSVLLKNTLRALALTGILGLGAAGAQAQTRVVIGVGAPVVAVVPPCPGVGYIWTPGYYAGTVFVPGRWIYRGYDRDRVVVVRDFHRDVRYGHDFHGRR
ncbi:MAG TPA: hypothetical protein VL990_17055 [Acidobacteriaceae bacterium]|nr:hypothetical protein [Acidobacteriaceae bacterium]